MDITICAAINKKQFAEILKNLGIAKTKDGYNCRTISTFFKANNISAGVYKSKDSFEIYIKHGLGSKSHVDEFKKVIDVSSKVNEILGLELDFFIYIDDDPHYSVDSLFDYYM